MSKKKKLLENTSFSKNSLSYYNNWLKFSDCREEHEYDELRKNLNVMWTKLTKEEKSEFKVLSSKNERSK